MICPHFASVLNLLIREYVLGKHGEPLGYDDLVSWLVREGISPSTELGKLWESGCKSCAFRDVRCFWNESKEGVSELFSEVIGEGFRGFLEGIDMAKRGEIPWEKLGVEFPFVWILGKTKIAIKGVVSLEVPGKDFERGIFMLEKDGRKFCAVPVSGSSDEEAVRIGAKVLKEYDKVSQKYQQYLEYWNGERFIAYLSRNNKLEESFASVHALPLWRFLEIFEKDFKGT